MKALPLASFKLRFGDLHVRVLPAQDEDGCPFVGAGVDLLGDEARAAFAVSEPILGWFDARQPGVKLRSLSYDTARRRVLVTLAVTEGRPRVLRIDAPASDAIVELAAPLLAHLDLVVRQKLRARR